MLTSLLMTSLTCMALLLSCICRGNASTAAQFRPFEICRENRRQWNSAAALHESAQRSTTGLERVQAAHVLSLRDDASVDVAHAGHAAERHGDVELLAENLDRLGDAGFPARAQPIDVGAADHAGARAMGERAHHVLPGADTAVEHQLDLGAHRLDDP